MTTKLWVARRRCIICRWLGRTCPPGEVPMDLPWEVTTFDPASRICGGYESRRFETHADALAWAIRVTA